MREGHRRAQDLFLELGESHGFDVRRAYSSRFPSDGVWLLPMNHGPLAGLPVVALEVVVTESPKTILGSIATLERIGAAKGVLLLQEQEIERRLLREGLTRAGVYSCIANAAARIDGHLASCRHRIERWSFAQLAYHHRLIAA